MENIVVSSLLSPTFIAGIFCGAFVLIVVVYLLNTYKTEEKDNKPNEKVTAPVEKKKGPTVTKFKKKTSDTKGSGRNEKPTYNHRWLCTSFKGHMGEILDMDISSNGKYLATCGDEDPDPGGFIEDNSSSSSEGNKENSRPPSTELSPQLKTLSRRQRKNRKREEGSPPDSKKKPKPKKIETMESRKVGDEQLKQFIKFPLKEYHFYSLLHNFLMTKEQMLSMGYPIETDDNSVVIFKNVYYPTRRKKDLSESSQFDVNAKEFVPNSSSSSSDSGDNVEEEDSASNNSSSSEQDSPSGENVYKGVSDSDAHCCVRCGRGFFIVKDGYLTHQQCRYHWGKFHHVTSNEKKEYSCCNGSLTSDGCCTGKLHVWSGLRNGFNTSLDGFTRTRPRRSRPSDGNYGVFALDCEMCYTKDGLELTKITVVTWDGQLVYDSFVKPENEIIDYNTRFSGITSKDMCRKDIKTLKEVQNDLMGFINSKTILIGHGLENDLRVLKMLHFFVVDTSYVFPHLKGPPYRCSLKTLSLNYLRQDIQCGMNGHNSYEDATTCMELMLWKIRKEYRYIYHHSK